MAIRRKITAAVANLSRQSMPRTVRTAPLVGGVAVGEMLVIGFASGEM